jgi:hypothetical protein
MRFTWDAEKNRRNILKHDVSFEVAAEVFGDPQHLVSQNYLIDGEQREQVIGMTEGLVLLLVVFVEHTSEGEDVIHIISARKANKYEEGLYAE